MHGLVGWITSEKEEGVSARDYLPAMLRVQPGGEKDFELSWLRNAAAAAQRSGASIAAGDGVLVVISGRPRFANAETGADSPAEAVLRAWPVHGRELPRPGTRGIWPDT